jgi:hypothetical protein
MVYITSIVSTKKRAPERGRRIDSFVRRRWANWLPTAGLGSAQPIEPDVLAKALAGKPADIQSWPRSRVRRWLEGTITVSAEGAFETGAALVHMGVPVSAMEAVFAAGHIAAFTELLALIAAEDPDAAATMAILPFAAFGFDHLNQPLAPNGQTRKLGEVSELALAELRGRSWPHEAFQRAWDRYVRSQTALGKVPAVPAQLPPGRKPWHMPAISSSSEFSRAALLAAHSVVSSLPPSQDSLDRTFSLVVDWVSGLPIEPTQLGRLMAFARRVEKSILENRHMVQEAWLELQGVDS